MKGFKKTTAAVLVAGLGFAESSQAALQSRNGGMVYDTDLNITWVADRNLFLTQYRQNTNLVNKIITANNGVVYDTSNSLDGYDGVYSLSTSDFNTTFGTMTWFGAQAWANSLVYGGFSDWRLPSTDLLTAGSLMGGEIGHLFYGELGGSTTKSLVSVHGANYDLFVNKPGDAYWTGNEYTSNAYYAWGFGYENYNGNRNTTFGKYMSIYAIAVRSGDVAAVPVPAAIWLFTSGLGLLAFSGRRKAQGKRLRYC